MRKQVEKFDFILKEIRSDKYLNKSVFTYFQSSEQPRNDEEKKIDINNFRMFYLWLLESLKQENERSLTTLKMMKSHIWYRVTGCEKYEQWQNFLFEEALTLTSTSSFNDMIDRGKTIEIMLEGIELYKKFRDFNNQGRRVIEQFERKEVNVESVPLYIHFSLFGKKLVSLNTC